MKTSRRRILLAIAMMAPSIDGCGCSRNHQVFVQERAGAPIQVDTGQGVRVKAPFVDVRVPPSRRDAVGRIDVPIVDPD